MADLIKPKRLVMLQALGDYLTDEIRKSNGYQHDLKAVYRGRMFIDATAPLPVLSIMDNPDPDRYPSAAGRRGYEHPTYNEDYILLIQGWSKDDKINPTDPAHYLMADVRKALAKIVRQGRPDEAYQPPADVFLLGGLITGLAMEPGVVRPPTEQASSDAFFYMRVSVGFSEDPNDPFNLS